MEKRTPLPPPKLPPMSKKNVKKETDCYIHSGALAAEIYVCEKCGAKMCLSCAIDRKYNQNKAFCPKCTAYLFVKKTGE